MVCKVYFAYKSMQAEEMDQWGECLPAKYEDLHSDPQNPTKQLSMVAVCVRNPGAGG